MSCRSSSSWSTTACTARTACTRSGEFPAPIVATALKNPDFAAYARAFGGHGATIETTAAFAPAFDAAAKSGKPAVLHLKVDPEAITPSTTLGAIRAKALAARGE